MAALSALGGLRVNQKSTPLNTAAQTPAATLLMERPADAPYATPPANANGTANNPPTPIVTEERGDAAVHGFWKRGRPCIFDVRITDTQAATYRNRDYAKVLAKAEKEKKDKYLKACHELRKDFTPLVYSVDGIAAREARTAEKHLAELLALRWKKHRSEMIFYVRVRMALAVVRANSLLIRGSRDRQRPRHPAIADRAAFNDWRFWHD